MTTYSTQDYENLHKAGEILGKIYKKILPQVTPGMKVADIVDSIELLITKSGAFPSFPPNLSVNTIAAHDTAMIAETRVIPENSLVKVDFGVQIDGCLTDCARTLAFGDVPVKLIDASKEALDNAIKMAKPGVKVGDIGAVINETIEKYGFKPIRNLTGHQIAKGTLHAGVSIPNVKAHGLVGNKKLEEGCTYAIEPFATNGKSGVVEDQPGSLPLIFSLHNNPKSSFGKKVYEKYKQVPFSARMASRLLNEGSSLERMDKILRTANKEGWHSYPPLWEVSDGLVGQSEDMILITKDGAEILTFGAYE
jgi:methionyl aminopeptidase